MKLATLNCKGLGDAEKASKTLQFLTENKIDLVVMCESHITTAIAEQYN